MGTTSIGFYIKPRLFVLENNNVISSGIELFNKEIKDINIYYMSDGFFVVELKNDIIVDNLNFEMNFKNKIDNSLFYTNYANVIYYLFVSIFNRKQLGYTLDLYDIIGDESIIVFKESDIWKKHSITSNVSGRISFNSNCFNSIYNMENTNVVKIEKNVLVECFAELSSVLVEVFDNDNLLQSLLLYVNAIINMKVGHFDISIVLFWSAIEKIIDEMWENMIKTSDYSSKTKQKLINSIEYTVSVKINELFLNKKISLNLVSKLNDSRKIRNKIIHGQYNLFSYFGDINGKFTNVVNKCIVVRNAATQLIYDVYDIELFNLFNIDIQFY